jgi:DNA invertase Pin-like site-specific DNA recombinase/RimJ/RimL family protein N-acetyltransferase
VFTDKASGRDTARPQLAELLRFARDGDTVVVHSMDRLARNLCDLRSLVQTLTRKGIRVEFVKEHLVFTGEDSPMAHLMLSVMGAFAEFERSLIKGRQREGITLAQQRGAYQGRKKTLTPEQAADLVRRAVAGIPKTVLARDYGISRETVYQYLRQATVTPEALIRRHPRRVPSCRGVTCSTRTPSLTALSIADSHAGRGWRRSHASIPNIMTRHSKAVTGAAAPASPCRSSTILGVIRSSSHHRTPTDPPSGVEKHGRKGSAGSKIARVTPWTAVQQTVCGLVWSVNRNGMAVFSQLDLAVASSHNRWLTATTFCGRVPAHPRPGTSEPGRVLSMTSRSSCTVALVAVDDVMLEALVQAAITDAAADEVTPPLSAGSTWTPERVAWLRGFHRHRRAGITGPAGEGTWAVVVGDRVVGSVRLARAREPGVLEAGIWLTRAARNQGLGQAAMAAVLREAAAMGADAVRAETTAGNAAALSVLRRLGFELSAVPGRNQVRALLHIDHAPPAAPPR